MERREEIKQWYDDWHRDHGVMSWRGPSHYRPLVKLLAPEPRGVLLDVGCGTGFFLRAAADWGLETYGLDISPEGARLAKQASPQSRITVGSMEDIEDVEKYDYITAFGSFEHCDDMKSALFAIYRALKPNGRFIVMVPNSKWEGVEMSIQEEIGETRMTMTDWAKLFRSVGFVIRNVGHDRLMWDPDVILDQTYQLVYTLDREAA
jgi:2-polyprenyl-3-methyl-5-hydroxy-6-metoxy-1,4-benzoquinol methylase